jgi:hypothetical protein
MTDLTANEKDYMKQTLNSLENLNRFLSDQTLSARAALPTDLYAYLARVKTILGNLNLGVSFAGNLAAKQYLLSKLPMRHSDAALWDR